MLELASVDTTKDKEAEAVPLPASASAPILPQAIPAEIVKRRGALDIYRNVALIVGAAVLISILGGFILAAIGVEAPQWIGTIVAVLAGALANMLSPRDASQ